MSSNRQYTDEFKSEAVKQVVERGFTVVDVATRIGIPRHTLYGWVQSARKAAGSTAGKTAAPASDSAEVRRLKAIALGVEAVKAGKSVYFGTLAEIVNSMAKAEREGTLRERVRFLARNSLLIVDEIGYLPIGSGGGNLFFQLVNACYERSAMILTSNRSFGEWGEVFGDPVVAAALLDRLLHHAIVVPIEGSSYRLREHADLIPDHLRSRAINPSSADSQPRRRGRPPKERSPSING